MKNLALPVTNPSLLPWWLDCELRGLADFRVSLVAAFRASSQRFNDAWLSPDARPRIMPSTLKSSSRSGQCMPSPPAISRQLFRSPGVPWSSRGYHTNGAEMLLPSDKVNDQTIVGHSHALGSCFMHLGIQRIHSNSLIARQNFLPPTLNAADFHPPKTQVSFESHRIEPKLRLAALPFDVDMGRLVEIRGVEKESVRTFSEDCGHT